MLKWRKKKSPWKRELAQPEHKGQAVKKFFKMFWPSPTQPTLETVLIKNNRKRKRRTLWLVLGSIVLIGLGYGFYWLNTLDFLQLKNIIVSSSGSGQQDVGIIQDIIMKQWQEKRFGFIPQNFYFAFSESEAIKNIRAQLAVENIKVQTFFPSVVRVELQQLPAKIIVGVGANFYALSNKGTVLKQLLDITNPPSAYPLVVFTPETVLSVEQEVIKEPVVDFLSRAHAAMAGLTLRKISDSWQYLDGPRPEVILKTKENFIIKFDPFDKAEDEIQNVELFLTQQLKTSEQRKDLEYIDARFGNKLFYK